VGPDDPVPPRGRLRGSGVPLSLTQRKRRNRPRSGRARGDRRASPCRDVDPRRIAVLGASVGASTAAWVAGSRPDQRLKAAIGLSPQETDAIKVAAKPRRFRPHDLLLVADTQELFQVKAIRSDVHGSGVTVTQSRDEGHGVDLMDYAPVRRAVIDWLNTRMRAS
jgi:pimeloyl-ACP methyl ester carboxylesterase